MDQSTLRSLRTRRRRRPTQIALAAVLLGALTASALVAGATEQSSSTLDDKTIAVLGFAAISDVGLAATSDVGFAATSDIGFPAASYIDSHDQREMDKALRNLYKGLADEFWALDGNSLARKGERVFKYDAKAIGGLLKIETDDVSINGAIDDIVATIVDIDLRLASAAIAVADLARADTTKAKESMIKAEEALASGDIKRAIRAYEKAWKHATRAQHKASKGGSSASDKYSVYEVVFVRANTVDTDSPEFITVSGSNEPFTDGDTGKSTEGYLFSDDFGPGDTFLDSTLWPGRGVMQLHVSCSDVFAGGVGQKSDPQASSEWLVNSFHIVKYKDGVIEKECDVVGAGLPTTPTVTATVTVPPPPPTTTTTTTTVTVPPPPPTTTTTTTTVTVPPPPPTTTTTSTTTTTMPPPPPFEA